MGKYSQKNKSESGSCILNGETTKAVLTFIDKKVEC